MLLASLLGLLLTSVCNADTPPPTAPGRGIHALVIGVDHYRFSTARQTGAAFPDLAGACTLEPEGTVLRVTPGDATKSYESIAAFLDSKLWTNLVWSDFRPLWYARMDGPLTSLPRPAYYFLSLYILSNVVRYTPEQLSPLTNPDSHVGWTIERFLNAAERFYPKLMFHWTHARKVFF